MEMDRQDSKAEDLPKYFEVLKRAFKGDSEDKGLLFVFDAKERTVTFDTYNMEDVEIAKTLGMLLDSILERMVLEGSLTQREVKTSSFVYNGPQTPQ